MGRVMHGYQTHDIVMTTQAAEALSRVQSKLSASGYSLVVYDSYRP